MHAVHFDLDGTLTTFDRPYADLLADACERVLDTRDPAVAEAYSAAFFERLRPVEPDPYETGARAAVAAADADADPERFVAALRDLEYGAATVREGIPALLDALAERPVGVVSNGAGAWQRGKLDAVGLAGRFDSVVTSYDAGVAKPAPGVFEYAAERLPADGHTMVGDDTEADVEGAPAAGWRGVHVETVDSPADLF